MAENKMVFESAPTARVFCRPQVRSPVLRRLRRSRRGRGTGDAGGRVRVPRAVFRVRRVRHAAVHRRSVCDQALAAVLPAGLREGGAHDARRDQPELRGRWVNRKTEIHKLQKPNLTFFFSKRYD